MSRFPDDFGGLYNEGDDSFVVLTVGNQDKVRSFADAYVSSGSPVVDAAMPLSYRVATEPLRRLEAIRDAIAADLPRLREAGSPVFGVGIDDRYNSVALFTTDASDSIAAEFDRSYGTQNFTVTQMSVPERTNRYNDTSPYYGGDQIVRSNGAACTSGFGVHQASVHSVLTAGHCGNTTWWNTSYASPSFTAARLMGTTAALIFSNNSLDIQRIAANSTKNFWANSALLQTVSAALEPTSGNSNCNEGSFTLGSCGTVYQHGISFTFADGKTTIGCFTIGGASALEGDSGGPIAWFSAYGPIAQGTVIGKSGPSITIGQGVDYIRYGLGVEFNTISSP